jgi:hypothetical protein
LGSALCPREREADPTDSRVVPGVSVPGTPIVDHALEYARQRCEPYLYNHVVRSWLFATRLGQLQSIEHDSEVVAVLHRVTPHEVEDVTLSSLRPDFA